MVEILTIVIGLIFLVFIGGMFIEANKEFMSKFVNERQYIKDAIIKWYKGTHLFMWINNRRNNVKILTEKEFNRMLQEGKIKKIHLI